MSFRLLCARVVAIIRDSLDGVDPAGLGVSDNRVIAARRVANGMGRRRDPPRRAVLGHVRAVHNHGAGDILEIFGPDRAQTLLIPFTKAAVPTVDLTLGRIIADPPEESGGE